MSPERNANCRCLFGAFAPVLWNFIEVDQIHPKISKFPTDCSKCRNATAKSAGLMSSYGSSSYPASFFIALQTYPGDHKNGYSTETVCFQVRGETKYSQIIFRHKSHKRIVQPACPDLNWQQHLLVSLTWDELIDVFLFLSVMINMVPFTNLMCPHQIVHVWCDILQTQLPRIVGSITLPSHCEWSTPIFLHFSSFTVPTFLVEINLMDV